MTFAWLLSKTIMSWLDISSNFSHLLCNVCIDRGGGGIFIKYFELLVKISTLVSVT